MVLAKSLMDLRPEELKGIIGDIPTLPTIYQELSRRMHDPEVCLPAMTDVIAQDPVLSAKILHLVNAAFYAQGDHVKTISRAVVILGFQAVRSAALAVSVLEYFKAGDDGRQDDLVKFWEHSVAAATICKELAPRLTIIPAEEAFVAGLLHDVGKLIERKYFASDFEDLCHAASEHHLSWYECERMLLQVHHAGIAKAMFVHWDFPPYLVEAVRHHHAPALAARMPQIAALVHVADVLAYRIGYGAPGAWPPEDFDPQALQILGFQPESFADSNPEVTARIEAGLRILTLL